jgi:hypothetical protein
VAVPISGSVSDGRVGDDSGTMRLQRVMRNSF